MKLPVSPLRLLASCTVVALAGAVWAVRAPESDAFRKWCEDPKPHFGRIPSPVDLSHLGAAYRAWQARKLAAGPRLRAATTLPSRWTACDQGWVTSVKDQGSYGTCWAHSALGSVESTLLRTGFGTWDLSENHLARHNVGFLNGMTAAQRFTAGGNAYMASALLLSWRDPLTEAEDPYANSASAVEAPPAFHVQQFVWIPARTGVDDNTTLKEALMTYGALDVGILVQTDSSGYTQSQYFKRPYGSYYYSNSDSNTGSNHGVLLVGWDDDYPASNFSTTPPGNGAFLIRNSWGNSSLTTNGYNWVSYYERSLCSEASAAYPVVEATNNYGRVYQYDPCGQIAKYNSLETDSPLPVTNNWCANVFTAVATGRVAAVGFYALSPGTKYVLRVSTGLTGVSPDTGMVQYETTNTVDFAGYVTVPLPEPVAIPEQGGRFAVSLLLDCPGEPFPIPVEQSDIYADPYSAYSTICMANAGESFYSLNGVAWKDFQTFDATANVCIKAYMEYGTEGMSQTDMIEACEPDETALSLWAGRDSCTFAVTLKTPEADAPDYTYSWRLDGVEVGTEAAYTFVPQSKDHGVRVVACRVRSGEYYDETSWSVTVNDTLRVTTTEELTNALLLAVSGDRVLVAPGTYEGEIDAPSSPIEIVSEGGPGVTFIERTSGACCYYGYYNGATVLNGFTLRNGSCNYGGGVCYGTVTNCVIENCEANCGGGVYYADVYSSVFRNNAGYNCGGGAYDAYLENCVISNCWSYNGGGVAGCTLVNCLVASNEVKLSQYYNWRTKSYVIDSSGGGAYESWLYNCTVVGNWGSGYGVGAYLQNYGGVWNSVVAANTNDLGYAYGHDIYGSRYYSMTNSLNGETPDAVAGWFADPAHGDWHLALGSPCIDAGTNDLVFTDADLDGGVRIFGTRVDIGCYEYSHVAEGWPVPAVEPDATPEEEAEAVSNALASAGFPSEVAAQVTTIAEYNALNAWAEKAGVTAADQAKSSTALLSPALGAAGLLELTSEDLKIEDMAVSSESGAVSFTLSLEAYEQAKVNPALLKAAVGVEGAESLDAKFSSDDLSLSLTPSETGITVTVTPPAAKSAYFLRTNVR